MTTLELEYQGETQTRRRWLAVALTYLSPGLGYMYVGHLLKGVTFNLLFVLLLEVFIIVLSLLKFFPLLPIAVLVLAWFVFSTLAALSVLDIIASNESEYVLKNYNHWVMYALIFLLTYLTPLAITAQFTSQHLWSTSRVSTAAMYPVVHPGDTLIIDRSSYRTRAPSRGELVAVRSPDSDDLFVLRVVAQQGDVVRMEGASLFVNDEAVEHSPLLPEAVMLATLDPGADMSTWVEHNNDQRYVVSISSRVFTEATVPPTELEAGQVFVLADNRSQIPLFGVEAPIRDSRVFGPVGMHQIEGQPLYIVWSTHPETSQTRWNRLGLPTH